jgi:hypothetical protein
VKDIPETSSTVSGWVKEATLCAAYLSTEEAHHNPYRDALVADARVVLVQNDFRPLGVHDEYKQQFFITIPNKGRVLRLRYGSIGDEENQCSLGSYDATHGMSGLILAIEKLASQHHHK